MFKVSFAIMALITNSSVQAAESGSGPAVLPAAIVPAGANQAAAAQVDGAIAAVPTAVKLNAGGAKTGMPALNVNYNIDQAKVQDIMKLERNFWRNDARKIEDLAQKSLVEPLEKTKVRMAGAMASILKPASQALPLIMKMFPNGATCKPDAFLDCVWKLPRRERRGDMIFRSACAAQSGCQPQQGTQADNQVINGKMNQVQKALGSLQNGIAQDFMNGQRQAGRVIGQLSQKWAKQTKGVMIRDFQCDADCVNKVRWNHFNPADFANGRCNCKLPITPGAVVDWTAEDFNTVSMQEWMEIADQEGLEVEEVTELVTDPAKTPATPAKTPATPATTPAVPVDPTTLFTKAAGVCMTVADSTKAPTLPVAALDKTLKQCLQACVDDALCLGSQWVTTPAVAPAAAVNSCYLINVAVSGSGTAATVGTADCYSKGVAGSNAVWWIIGVLAIIGLAFGIYMYLKKTGKIGGGEEGGAQEDLYMRFLD